MDKKEKGEKRQGKAWLSAFAALFLAALVGFGVPIGLQRWQDVRREMTVTTYEAALVRITAQAELSLAEKAELLQSETLITTELEKGKNYDKDSCLQKAEEELEKLKELGVLGEDFSEAVVIEDAGQCEAMPNFCIDSSGEQSLIVWTVTLPIEENGQSWSVFGIFDDETGKFLQLDALSDSELAYDSVDGEIQEDAAGAETAEAEELRIAAEGLGAYLDLSLQSVRPVQETEEILSGQVGYLDSDGGKVRYIFYIAPNEMNIDLR